MRMEEIAQRMELLEKGVSRGLLELENRSQPVDSHPAKHSNKVWLDAHPDDADDVAGWRTEGEVVFIVTKADDRNDYRFTVYENLVGGDGALLTDGTHLDKKGDFKHCFPKITNARAQAIRAISSLELGRQFGPFQIEELDKMTIDVWCKKFEINAGLKKKLIRAQKKGKQTPTPTEKKEKQNPIDAILEETKKLDPKQNLLVALTLFKHVYNNITPIKGSADVQQKKQRKKKGSGQSKIASSQPSGIPGGNE